MYIIAKVFLVFALVLSGMSCEAPIKQEVYLSEEYIALLKSTGSHFDAARICTVDNTIILQQGLVVRGRDEDGYVAGKQSELTKYRFLGSKIIDDKGIIYVKQVGNYSEATIRILFGNSIYKNGTSTLEFENGKIYLDGKSLGLIGSTKFNNLRMDILHQNDMYYGYKVSNSGVELFKVVPADIGYNKEIESLGIYKT